MTTKTLVLVTLGLMAIVAACTPVETQIEDDKLVIALMTDLSTPASIYGNAAVEGAKKAVANLEAKGANIELLIEDNKNSPSEAVKAYQKLRTMQPDVMFSTFSGATVATAPLAHEDGFPFVSTIAFANVQEYDNAYQYFSTPEDQAVALVTFLESQNITKIVLMAQAIEAGEVALQEAERELSQTDIEVVLIERHTPTSTDLRTEMLKANELGAQAIYVFNLNAPAVAESIKNHFNGIIIWAETPVPSRLYETAPELDGTYSTSPLHAIPETVANNRFIEQFGNQRTPFHAAYAYDLVNILWEARNQPHPDGILGLGVYEGVAGDVNLSASRRPRFEAGVVYIQNFSVTRMT